MFTLAEIYRDEFDLETCFCSSDEDALGARRHLYTVESVDHLGYVIECLNVEVRVCSKRVRGEAKGVMERDGKR